jgi:hypothetical protein
MVVVIVIVVAIVGGLAYAEYLYQPAPCCVPEPARGQLFMQSYNFQTSGNSGSLFVVLGVFEGEGLNVSQVSLDGTLANLANSNLVASCGTQSYGTPPSQWTGYVCTLTITFGPSFPAPSSGSEQNLRVVMSDGVASVFQVTAGYLYEATSTAAYPIVNVSGTVYQGCVGSRPVGVTFTDEGGARYTAGLSSTGNSFTYSVSLVNGHDYQVTLEYTPVVPNASTQTADAGSLNLAAESPTYYYNIPC